MQKNFNNQKSNLSAQDIDDIMHIIGNRCHYKTKVRLRSILTYGPRAIQECGILARLLKDEHGWEYCAGQDYTAEIKTVRDVILGRI